MPYLTQEEYTEMGFALIGGPFSFDQLLNRAIPLLDNVTRHFYRKNDMEADYPYRVEQFKRAIGCQIEYFYENKALTSNKLNNRPASVSMGRTSVSYGSNSKKGGETATKPMLCPDVYVYLEGTGLLNRGV